jgi:hypothetical protein
MGDLVVVSSSIRLFAGEAISMLLVLYSLRIQSCTQSVALSAVCRGKYAATPAASCAAHSSRHVDVSNVRLSTAAIASVCWPCDADVLAVNPKPFSKFF